MQVILCKILKDSYLQDLWKSLNATRDDDVRASHANETCLKINSLISYPGSIGYLEGIKKQLNSSYRCSLILYILNKVGQVIKS